MSAAPSVAWRARISGRAGVGADDHADAPEVGVEHASAVSRHEVLVVGAPQEALAIGAEGLSGGVDQHGRVVQPGVRVFDVPRHDVHALLARPAGQEDVVFLGRQDVGGTKLRLRADQVSRVGALREHQQIDLLCGRRVEQAFDGLETALGLRQTECLDLGDSHPDHRWTSCRWNAPRRYVARREGSRTRAPDYRN